MADRVVVDGAVDAVAEERAVRILDALDAKPVLADRIRRIVGLVALARHGMRPLGIDELRARTHLESARRRAVRLAEPDGKRGHDHAIFAGARAEVQAVVALRDHGAERSDGQLETLADLDRGGVLDLVEPRDQPPVAAELLLADDLLERVVRLDRVLRADRVVRVVDGRQEELRAEAAECVRRLPRLGLGERVREHRLRQKQARLHGLGGSERESFAQLCFCGRGRCLRGRRLRRCAVQAVAECGRRRSCRRSRGCCRRGRRWRILLRSLLRGRGCRLRRRLR